MQQSVGMDGLTGAFLTPASDGILVYLFSKSRFASTEFVLLKSARELSI